MSEKIIKFGGDTTSRELWDGGPVGSTGMSRELDPTSRSFAMVAFQQAKPILDSELNVTQQMQNHLRAEVLRKTLSPGFLSMNVATGITDVKNAIRISGAVAHANGWLLAVNGANRDDSQSDVIFPAAPYSGSREDVAFLECWFQEVAPSGSPEVDDENVYKYGGTQSGTLQNDLMDSVAGDETTRRIQLRWRLRTVSDINFTNYPLGIDNADRVKVRGGADGDKNYTFSNIGNSLFRGGDGTTAACTALDCVDGYVYALPLFRVHRRNQTAYNKDDNPQGAPAYATGTIIPSGQYYDVIAPGDVTALWSYASPYDGGSADIVNTAIADLMNRLRQASLELDKWQNQRLQQGKATIYNKFVVFGAIINPISGTRNVQITRTGTYSTGNYSLICADGKFTGIADSSASVAAVPTNVGTTAVNYYAYIDYDSVSSNYKVYVADAVPVGRLGLYRITVPAGDVAANLNAVSFTDIRRVESDYKNFYASTPYAVVTLAGYAAINSPEYDVQLSVESASDKDRTQPEVYDKASNGFKIRNLGTSDNAAIRWTLINPEVN